MQLASAMCTGEVDSGRGTDSDQESVVLDASLHEWNGRRKGAPPARRAGQQAWEKKIASGVDDFLLKLPLGSSAKAAVLEEQIGRKLYAAEREKGHMQEKVVEWCVPHVFKQHT